MNPENRHEDEDLVEHLDWNTWSWKVPGTEFEFDLKETIGLGLAVVLFILGIYMALRAPVDSVDAMSVSKSGSRSRPFSVAEASLSKQLSATALSKGSLVRKTTPRTATKRVGLSSPRKGKAAKASASKGKGPKKIIVEM